MKILLVIYVIGVIVSSVRIIITHKNRSRVIDEIYKYQTWCVATDNFDKIFDVDFSDMESYNKTLYRITDWGHNNILPEDKQHILNTYMD